MLPNRIADGAAQNTLPQATIDAARRCRYFLAENSKSARAFLKAVDHPGPIADLHIEEIGHQPDVSQYEKWLRPLTSGEDGAVVSEAGCPGIADPGAGLVACAHRLGIRVVPLVGPCSLLLTVMASGLDGQHFRFHGYLPLEETELKAKLAWLEEESRAPETEIFIETPYRNNRMAGHLAQYLHADTFVTIATDVTGPAESIRTVRAQECRLIEGTLPKLPTVFAIMSAHPRPPKPHGILVRHDVRKGFPPRAASRARKPER